MIMKQAELISIAEEFLKWLVDTAEKYNMSEPDLQALIKQLLNG